jgi:hypothetical protein
MPGRGFMEGFALTAFAAGTFGQISLRPSRKSAYSASESDMNTGFRNYQEKAGKVVECEVPMPPEEGEFCRHG